MGQQHIVVVVSILSCASLCSCGVVPASVTYSDSSNSSPDTSGYAFRQKRSLLLLQTDQNNKLTVVASPSELDSNGAYTPIYRITGVDNFRSTTQLTATYIDNTKLLDELTVTTTDNVADTINKIGDVAKAAIPLVATVVSGTAQPVGSTFKPTVVDPALAASKGWQPDPLNSSYCVRLRDISVESDQTMSQFLSSQSTFGSFPVPACVSATLDVAKVQEPSSCSDVSAGNGQLTSVHVTYAHDTNIVPISLPSSGSVKMGTICGASVTVASKQDRSNVLTYLQTALQQAQDVRTAWKTAKDGSKNTSTTASGK